jgi:hypothetical protein
MYRARGLFVLALCLRRWAAAVKATGVIEWADRATAKNQAASQQARLGLTKEEAAAIVFITKGPQVPCLHHRDLECGFAHLFSDRANSNNDAQQRSVFAGALAVILGSTRNRLYHRTTLVNVGTL